jgi:TPR repeat protein
MPCSNPEGGRLDLDEERRRYEESAESGSSAAMNSLGVLYADRMSPPDLVLAKMWYERAVEAVAVKP